jgi:hypothetical protein
VKLGRGRLTATQWLGLRDMAKAGPEGLVATSSAVESAYEALATGRAAREANGPLAAKEGERWRITEIGRKVLQAYE